MTPAPFVYLSRGNLSQYLINTGSEPSWALITGASDGIGYGFAQELLTRGFNVILHGRNATKLSRTRDTLSIAHPRSAIRTLVADASSFTQSTISTIASDLSSLPLTLLINNVGGGAIPADRPFKPFTDHTPSDIDALISLNLTFPVQLTLALLPLLQKQPKSLVLNTGSQAALGCAFLPVYGATKAALRAWTRALAAEQRDRKTGVEVLEFVVASVQSGQNPREKATWLVPSSRAMAKAALERVGCGGYSVVGYWSHWLQLVLFAILPWWVLDLMVIGTLKPMVEGKKTTW